MTDLNTHYFLFQKQRDTPCKESRLSIYKETCHLIQCVGVFEGLLESYFRGRIILVHSFYLRSSSRPTIPKKFIFKLLKSELDKCLCPVWEGILRLPLARIWEEFKKFKRLVHLGKTYPLSIPTQVNHPRWSGFVKSLLHWSASSMKTK